MVLYTDMSSAQDPRRLPRKKRTRTERTKRDEILAAAVARFSRDGYENTKWADVAADVGVGSTALYHYFDSKQHCLFVILDDAIQDALARFERITAAEPDFERALPLLVADAFDLTVLDIQRLRVLEAEHGLLARRHVSAPEGQQARQAARAHTRDLELAWATFLGRAMDAGAVPIGAASRSPGRLRRSSSPSAIRAAKAIALRTAATPVTSDCAMQATTSSPEATASRRWP